MTQILRERVTKEEDREYSDFICLWPSATEVAAFKKLMSVEVGGQSHSVNADGYRLKFMGLDEVRGRCLYDTHLAQSSVFFGGDVLYYLNSGDLVEMFACHPKIGVGLDFVFTARHFDPQPGSLALDRYQFEAQPASTMVQRVKVSTTSPVLDSAGAPVYKNVTNSQKKTNDALLKKWKKARAAWDRQHLPGVPCPKRPVLPYGRDVQTKTTSTMVDESVEVPELAEVNYVEGHGLVDPDGVLNWFSSCLPGDAVYQHKVKGNDFFTHTKLAIQRAGEDGVLKFYQISIHVEWNCGPMVLLKVRLQQIDAPGVTIGYDRPAPSFVTEGVITSLLPNLCAKAQGIDMERAESIESLYNSAYRMMVQSLGKANFDKLTMYHEFLMESTRRTAEKAIVMSRVTITAEIHSTRASKMQHRSCTPRKWPKTPGPPQGLPLLMCVLPPSRPEPNGSSNSPELALKDSSGSLGRCVRCSMELRLGSRGKALNLN
jgi:hypothetical protein